jgi:antitoxin (DNA-binding transcriptional repressor) of toxin-antitoxin stability system
VGEGRGNTYLSVRGAKPSLVISGAFTKRILLFGGDDRDVNPGSPRLDQDARCSHNSYMETKSPKAVGARELKTRLGAYLALVRRGATLVVTERGLPVAELKPIGARKRDLDAIIAEMIALGEAARESKEPFASFTPVRVRKGSVSRTIIDQRKDRVL